MRYVHYSEALTLRIPTRLARRLDDAARAQERTRSEYVRELLRRELLVSRAGGVDDEQHSAG